MSLSDKIRAELMASFRAELAEHVQTMTDGLLAIEQAQLAPEERQTVLQGVFRAAHSLKGAARAVDMPTVEQLAHGLEHVLNDLQKGVIATSPVLFDTCYHALDAIRAAQTAGENDDTACAAALLQTLTELDALCSTPAHPKKERHCSENPGTGKTPSPFGTVKAAEPEPLEADIAPTQTRANRSGKPAHTQQTPTVGFTPVSAQGMADGDETIRVSVAKLDVLMDQLSELLTTKIRAEQRLEQIRSLQQMIGNRQKDWLGVRAHYNQLERQTTGQGRTTNAKHTREMTHVLDYIGTAQEEMRAIHALVNILAREYAHDTMQMSLVIDELEQEIKRVRMLPLHTITGPFARMVRDLAHEAGKQVHFQLVGGDTELDKRVLEQMKDPLIHLLRNAVDHGIEPPQRREAAGKPVAGRVTLAAQQQGKDVTITVSDDGAGLDTEAIRRALMRQGTTAAEAMNDNELADAIFQAGISSSPIITDISGRGVGLDVVRRNVEALQGRIDLHWTAGTGMSFVITLPLTLTSSHGLLVRAGGDVFAIPLGTVERIAQIAPQDIVQLEGNDTILYEGKPLTLVRLNDVLEIEPSSGPDPSTQTHILTVILVAADRRMAFVVDELCGEQEIVIKSIGKQLSRVGGVAGATVMGNGDIVLVLNVADLIRLALRGKRRSVLQAAEESMSLLAARARQHILVVDDSITTRMLEKNILEAAGYTVTLAVDGREALDIMAKGTLPHLIVSDLDMPRLNGFLLTEQVKQSARTAQIPVVLVTSLDSPEDKARGIEVGADAYIIKSSFDQQNLLETIEQLI